MQEEEESALQELEAEFRMLATSPFWEQVQ
jgi:hypothetical protein